MVDLEIKSFMSPDVDVDHWQPASNSEVAFLLELAVGTKDDERSDLFQVMVASPEGMATLKPNSDGVISDRAVIVMATFSWAALKRVLASILARCSAPDWNQAVLKLQRFFEWEYEDFVQETEN